MSCFVWIPVKQSNKKIFEMVVENTKLQTNVWTFERNSLRYRGAKLLNLFIEKKVLPPKFNELFKLFVSLVHKIRDNYILSNNELTKTIFS